MQLLNKKTTMALHGVAILMMIYHHLFISGNVFCVSESKSIFDIFNSFNFTNAPSAQLAFAYFCKICVAIFAFTSGYAIYLQLSKRCVHDNETDNTKEMISYCSHRFLSFYKKYLIAFLFFIGCEYFLGNPNGFDFSLTNYVLNLLGFRATFNGTWWYVSVYYVMIISSPFIYLLLNKLKNRDYLFLLGLFIISFLAAFVSGNTMTFLKLISKFVQNYFMIYLIIFAEGMFCAKTGLIDKIGSKLNLLTAVALLIVTYFLRTMLIRDPSDPLFDLILIIPFIISFAKIISYMDGATSLFSFFGKYSAYMWYAHAYFYAYLFFTLLFKNNLSLIIYIQVVLYSLVSGIIFAQIENLIGKLIKKIKA